MRARAELLGRLEAAKAGWPVASQDIEKIERQSA